MTGRTTSNRVQDRFVAFMWKHAGWLIWGWCAVMIVLAIIGFFRGTL